MNDEHREDTSVSGVVVPDAMARARRPPSRSIDDGSRRRCAPRASWSSRPPIEDDRTAAAVEPQPRAPTLDRRRAVRRRSPRSHVAARPSRSRRRAPSRRGPSWPRRPWPSPWPASRRAAARAIERRRGVAEPEAALDDPDARPWSRAARIGDRPGADGRGRVTARPPSDCHPAPIAGRRRHRPIGRHPSGRDATTLPPAAHRCPTPELAARLAAARRPRP